MVWLSLMLVLLAPSGAAKSGGIDNTPAGCNCHAAAPDPGVVLEVDGLPATFEAGTTYNLTLRVSDEVERVEDATALVGFNLWTDRGTLASTDDAVQAIGAELTHTSEGNDQRTWNVTWTAPGSDEVTAKIRFTANAVNGDGDPSDADHWNRLVIEIPGVNAEGGGLPHPGLVSSMGILMFAALWRRGQDPEPAHCAAD